MNVNKIEEVQHQDKTTTAAATINRIKLSNKLNTYYSNKYGLREELVEVIIYYDQVEFVLDDNTSYYLRKEMFYFIQNYLEQVTDRFVNLEQENEKINYQNMIRQIV